MPYDILDNQYGIHEGECQACEKIVRLNDISLCEDCDAKFDRDCIRQRKWEYSASAFGVPQEKLEDLRSEVIRLFGNKMELIAEE